MTHASNDRAECLLAQIRPILPEILRSAPYYGSCVFEVTMHDENAAFVEERKKPYTK